ncbi:putative MFS multidrug transporter [Aspergillus glaucus CBS 516.65]|uniref:Major facilitator superfamily (MFS) profile domain-containing protein n=1 Tax=Aspergillus glaucus CBS 516.65 TaxID=1160497 RepID=A0A1L9VPJ6_ASPGL|nr:hypothetical protein ASPGLDRAFT_65065 [Aspergillus glaucus CBS 516.65]OJJ85836.1 hypothetical protein ASPGLDRAFT_65065 [Aspergillus glaucus CBS 516.65]
MSAPPPPSVYTVLSEREKVFTLLIATSVNFLGPASANIYFPALGEMAKDLNVSNSQINLTITSYMIVQGLVPLLTGNLSDQKGCRPVLLMCLLIYLGVNIGLALQDSFAALITLRCLQSFGSSGATVISTATVSDLITRAERGKYMAYVSLGFTLGPAFLGWRSIFWFLAILAGVIILVIAPFLRETCRVVVGNGSVPPQPWNKPISLALAHRSSPPPRPDYSTVVSLSSKKNCRCSTVFGIFDSLKVVLNKPVGVLILCSTVFFCGFMSVMSSIPALLEQKYNFNALEIGLCYIPFAVGGFAARWTQTREQLEQIPLEKVRLELGVPLVYLSCLSLLGYSWVMNYDVHISAPLTMLFLLGNTIIGANNTFSTLMIDLHAYRPATAIAGMNMYKFLCGAGAVAAVLPLVGIIGIGWVGTVIAGLWLVVSPGLWMIYFYGHAWRKSLQSEQA